MAVSHAFQLKVAEWRQKAHEGTLTQDEMREAITFLRGERLAIASTATASKSKTTKPVINVDDLFSELGL